jgi:hypothetical protein
MDVLKDINAALTQSNNEDFDNDIELEFASLSIDETSLDANSINSNQPPIKSIIHTPSKIPTKLKNTSNTITNLPVPPISNPFRDNNNSNSKEKNREPIAL